MKKIIIPLLITVIALSGCTSNKTGQKDIAVEDMINFISETDLKNTGLMIMDYSNGTDNLHVNSSFYSEEDWFSSESDIYYADINDKKNAINGFTRMYIDKDSDGLYRVATTNSRDYDFTYISKDSCPNVQKLLQPVQSALTVSTGDLKEAESSILTSDDSLNILSSTRKINDSVLEEILSGINLLDIIEEYCTYDVVFPKSITLNISESDDGSYSYVMYGDEDDYSFSLSFSDRIYNNISKEDFMNGGNTIHSSQAIEDKKIFAFGIAVPQEYKKVVEERNAELEKERNTYIEKYGTPSDADVEILNNPKINAGDVDHDFSEAQ